MDFIDRQVFAVCRGPRYFYRTQSAMFVPPDIVQHTRNLGSVLISHSMGPVESAVKLDEELQSDWSARDDPR